MKRFVPIVAALSVTAIAASASAEPEFRTRVELGFLDVLSHKIQFGRDGTYIDYQSDAGQDNLFGFGRASADVALGRHNLTFLYQPLSLETQAVFPRDIQIDDVEFPEGTPVDVKYGFPFYRLSYAYDVVPRQDTWVELGGSLQLRNATLVFTSVDGSLRRLERDVGPVPILRARAGHEFDNGTFLETEMDGFYAPVSYINGDDNDVVGAILDASLRYGWILDDTYEVFLNGRYLGGGSSGVGDESEFGDGFTRNWLHFATITLGFGYRL